MLDVQLVPRPLWGRSLSERCRTSWRAIRADAGRRAAGRCHGCEAPLPERGWIGHEVWSYDDDRGVATLVDVVAICPLCNDALHCGRISALVSRGQLPSERLDAIGAHLMRVNGLDRIGPYIHTVIQTWKARSARDWRLELGEFDGRVTDQERAALVGATRPEPDGGRPAET